MEFVVREGKGERRPLCLIGVIHDLPAQLLAWKLLGILALKEALAFDLVTANCAA